MERYNDSFQNERNSSFKVSPLERKWQQILEEERNSILRNKKLLEDFDRVDQQSKVFSKKSDRLKQAKHTFELYVSSVYPKWTKDVKQLQQAKKRTFGKESKHSSNLTDKDYSKQKNPGYSFHDTANLGNLQPNLAFSSTPYRNGIDFDEHERLQLSGRNESGRNEFNENDHLSYSDHPSYHETKPFDHLMSRMNEDRSRNHPEDTSYGMPHYGDQRYSPFRQSYPMPWRNTRHSYQDQHSYMFEPRMRNGPAGFSQFRSYDDTRSEASTFQEFQRGSRNERYGVRMERSPQEYYTYPRRDESYAEVHQDYHQDGKQRGTGGYQDERQQQRSTSTGDHDRRQQDIDGYQDGRHPDTGDHEGGRQGDTVTGYQDGRHRHTGDHEGGRQGDTVFGYQDGRRRHTGDHEVGRQGNIDDSMKSQNVQNYHSDRGISQTSSQEKLMKERRDHHVDLKRSPELKDMVVDHEVNEDTSRNGNDSQQRENRKTRDRSVEKLSRVDDERIKSRDGSFDQNSSTSLRDEESSSVEKESGGNETKKKMQDLGSKGMDNTESISLPTIHKFEGDIQEIYSELSDTEQVSRNGGDVVSESDHAGLPATNEVNGTEQRNSLQGTNPNKTDDGEGTEVVRAITEKASNREAGVKENDKTSIMDDLLGDDVSDFEVSDSEISEEVPNEKVLDAAAGATEIPKNVLQETGGPEKTESEIEKKFVDPEAVNERDLTKRGLSSSNVNGHSSSEEDGKKDEWNTPSRTELNSQNNSESLNEDTKSEKRNDPEGKDLNSEESLQQQGSSKDNISSEAAPVKHTKTKRLVIDEKTFLVLLQMVDDAIEVSFSTELLYRNHDCSMEKKEEVLRTVESGGSLAQFDAAVISMILLNQLSHLVRASDEGCLITAEILNVKCSTEKDFRETIPGSLTSLWKSLFLHFMKLMRNNIMNAEKIAEIFSPCLVSSHCTSTEKAISFLARILCNSQEADDEDTQSKEEESGHDQESEDEKNRNGLLEELSFTSEESNSQPVSNEAKNNRKKTENKTENTGTVSYSEDFEEEKSVRLTESDAYQRMLSSIKVSDEEEDVEEDLLGGGTMSEANTSIQPSQKQPVAQSANIPTKSAKTLKSKPKLSLFSSGERDDFGDSFGHDGEGILTSSWKSSEMSLSLPLSPDMDTGGYVPTAAAATEMKEKDGKEAEKGVITETKVEILSSTKKDQKIGKPEAEKEKPKLQESNTKSRIQAGFWNHSDSESEVDLQASHGADDDDDDFDFYS